MIFSGDTVFPFKKYDKTFLEKIDNNFLNKPKIVNLESLIELENMKKVTKGIALSSTKQIVSFLKDLNVIGCSLANNHITDFDTSIDKQKEYLFKNGIQSFGAGDDIEKASKPIFYNENGQKYAVLAFGWEVIGCRYATASSKGVNPFSYEHIISSIKKLYEEDKNISIILTIHNNYEFELYPQPAHRKMFFDLIDEFDIKAIFCHHPHIVGGCEVYKNAPIFYSLGNFYLPETNYNGYDLKYNDEAKVGLVVDFRSTDVKLYWTYKDSDNSLKITDIENLNDSQKIQKLTHFSGMSHSDYIKWFKHNRKKSKGLPIYKNNNVFEEKINNFLVAFRQSFIDFLVRKGVK